MRCIKFFLFSQTVLEVKYFNSFWLKKVVKNGDTDPSWPGLPWNPYGAFSVTITVAGTGYSSAPNVTTTRVSGTGGGLIVDTTAVGGAITAVKIINPGTNIASGDQFIINDDFSSKQLKGYDKSHIAKNKKDFKSYEFINENNGNTFIRLSSRVGQLSHFNKGQEYIKDRIELGTRGQSLPNSWKKLEEQTFSWMFDTKLPENVNTTNAEHITITQLKTIEKNNEKKQCHPGMPFRINYHDRQTWIAVTDGLNIKHNKKYYYENFLTNEWINFKNKSKGRWWIPGEESNDYLGEFINTWLSKWTGLVEETIFDVNMFSLSEECVLVNNYNKEVFEFLKKHKIEPIICPMRHRYFWDGGVGACDPCVQLEPTRGAAVSFGFCGVVLVLILFVWKGGRELKLNMHYERVRNCTVVNATLDTWLSCSVKSQKLEYACGAWYKRHYILTTAERKDCNVKNTKPAAATTCGNECTATASCDQMREWYDGARDPSLVASPAQNVPGWCHSHQASLEESPGSPYPCCGIIILSSHLEVTPYIYDS